MTHIIEGDTDDMDNCSELPMRDSLIGASGYHRPAMHTTHEAPATARLHDTLPRLDTPFLTHTHRYISCNGCRPPEQTSQNRMRSSHV